MPTGLTWTELVNVQICKVGYEPALEVKSFDAFLSSLSATITAAFFSNVKCLLSPGFVTKAVDKLMNKS